MISRGLCALLLAVGVSTSLRANPDQLATHGRRAQLEAVADCLKNAVGVSNIWGTPYNGESDSSVTAHWGRVWLSLAVQHGSQHSAPRICISDEINTTDSLRMGLVSQGAFNSACKKGPPTVTMYLRQIEERYGYNASNEGKEMLTSGWLHELTHVRQSFPIYDDLAKQCFFGSSTQYDNTDDIPDANEDPAGYKAFVAEEMADDANAAENAYNEFLAIMEELCEFHATFKFENDKQKQVASDWLENRCCQLAGQCQTFEDNYNSFMSAYNAVANDPAYQDCLTADGELEDVTFSRVKDGTGASVDITAHLSQWKETLEGYNQDKESKTEPQGGEEESEVDKKKAKIKEMLEC